MHPAINSQALSLTRNYLYRYHNTIFKADPFKESGTLDMKINTKPYEPFIFITPTLTNQTTTFLGFIYCQFKRS